MVSAAAELQVRLIARDEYSKVLKNANKETSSFGKTLGDVTKIASGFLAANVFAGATQKVTGFFSQSIDYAKDLGESINAVNVVFGKSAKEIQDWGKNNATQFGLSQRAFNELATPLGAMLKNAGLDMSVVSSKTIDLTKRAADMASVFNVDVSEALSAIQAGLRGEADPLERFGVGLSAAKVEARALADTGKTVASSLTDQEKMMARLSLIMEQTTDVAGDFANTSDSLANKQRIQAARTEELQAALGQKLLPVMLLVTDAKLKLVSAVVDHVLPALDSFIKYMQTTIETGDTLNDWLTHLPEPLRGVAKLIGELALVLTNVLWPAFKNGIEVIAPLLAGFFNFILDNEPLLVVAIAAVGAAIVLALGPVSLAFLAVTGITTAIGVLKDALPELQNQFDVSWRRIQDSISSKINVIIGDINSLIEAYNRIPLAPNLPTVPKLATDSAYQERLRQLGETEFPDVPAYASGTSWVPRTGLALLHQGEAVIPASQNRGGLTVVVQGDVYGFDDFERKVNAAVANGKRRGMGYGFA